MIRGTGPKTVPASDVKTPAWISAMRTPPPSAARQSTLSVSTPDGRDGCARSRPPGAAFRGAAPLALEVAVVLRGSGAGLALVLRPELARAVRPLDGARHLEEADLADLHASVERDRQIRDVRQLERQIALPSRVDIAGRGVDEQAESAQTRLPVQAHDKVLRQLDPLQGLAEDELVGMEDEGLVIPD